MPEPRGPWQIVGTRQIYQDPWLRVRRDDVIRPDGAPGTHCIVYFRRGVSVLLLDDCGQVYLTDEFHYGVGRRTLEVVSGGIEDGEDPLTCAQREAAEELGITADEWIELGDFDPFTTMVDSPSKLYLARKLSFGTCRPEGTEQIRCVKVPFAEAVEMALDGRITHGPSCVALFRAQLLLARAGANKS